MRTTRLLRSGFAAVAAVLVAGVGIALWMHSPGVSAKSAIHVGKPLGDRVERSNSEWQRLLSPETYRVTRLKGTERAFTGAYWKTKDDGIFACACCGQPLFDSSAKFDSGTGWPSFTSPANQDAVSLFQEELPYDSRIEVVCSRCDAHLGHVFDDGPRPTFKRYCINSAALKFQSR